MLMLRRGLEIMYRQVFKKKSIEPPSDLHNYVNKNVAHNTVAFIRQILDFSCK